MKYIVTTLLCCWAAVASAEHYGAQITSKNPLTLQAAQNKQRAFTATLFLPPEAALGPLQILIEPTLALVDHGSHARQRHLCHQHIE